MTEISTPFPVEAGGAHEARAERKAGLRRIPMRPLKIGFGMSVLLAGMYGVVSDRQLLSSESAVVSAYVTEVRSPIEGVVSGLPVTTGGRVEASAVLGTVDNRSFDQQHLDNLTMAERQARSGAAAAAAEEGVLQAQGRELAERAAIHLAAVRARLTGQQAEAQRMLAARSAEVEEARVEMERGRRLHEAGIVADADFDRLGSRLKVAAAEEAAARSAVETVETELEAARTGVLNEPGVNNDVPYSRQRADEVRLLVADLNRSKATLRAQADEAEARAGLELERMQGMHHTELTSPVAGMLWKLDATNGERVGTGDGVARVVDCDRSFVLAEVPQERATQIAIGAAVRLRLAGEERDRAGKVSGILSDTQREDDSKLAAFPVRNPRHTLATVQIALGDSDRRSCLVGRTAQVSITVNEGSLLGGLWHRLM